jgi:hypothetical protein
MAFERTPVILHGYSGELIEAGSNALYYEAPFRGQLLEDFLEASKHKVWVQLVSGEFETPAVILNCWYNMETRRVLVQLLAEKMLVSVSV